MESMGRKCMHACSHTGMPLHILICPSILHSAFDFGYKWNSSKCRTIPAMKQKENLSFSSESKWNVCLQVILYWPLMWTWTLIERCKWVWTWITDVTLGFKWKSKCRLGAQDLPARVKVHVNFKDKGWDAMYLKLKRVVTWKLNVALRLCLCFNVIFKTLRADLLCYLLCDKV